MSDLERYFSPLTTNQIEPMPAYQHRHLEVARRPPNEPDDFDYEFSDAWSRFADEPLKPVHTLVIEDHRRHGIELVEHEGGKV